MNFFRLQISTPKHAPAVIWERCKNRLFGQISTQFLTTRAVIMLCVLLVSAPYSPHGFAQSTDSCLSARLADALTICQALINNGSRDVDVYWTLSSAQYQNGQQTLANRTLAQALRVHPGNSKLETLAQIISTDSTEQKRIAQSSKLNQNSIDKGALKITCLTKSGDLAITACTRRLALTNEDGDRIRARLSLLRKAKTNTRFGSAPSRPIIQTPIVVTPSPTVITPPIQIPSPQPSTLSVRSAAYKKLVANVQSRLNNFGFNAGLADGVPGDKTRKALAAFYTAIQAPVKKSISSQTLNDLSIAQVQLDKAQDLLIESQLALSKGDVKTANTKLITAKRTSVLLKTPANLQRVIQASLGSTQQPVTPTIPTTPTPTPTIPSQNIVTATPPQFGNLMNQINILQGQIQRQQSDQENRLNTLRDAL